MHGPTCIFWANLTPSSRKASSGEILKVVGESLFGLTNAIAVSI